MAALLLGLVLLATGSPAAAQDANPTATATSGQAQDIADLLPVTLAGLVPEIEVIRGAENLDESDPFVESFLETLGVPVEAMTMVTAVADDGTSFAFLGGIQVAGADAETLLQLYLLSLMGSMTSPYQELGEIGGKTATMVMDGDEPNSAPLFVYANGDTVWLILAEQSVVEDVFEQLP